MAQEMDLRDFLELIGIFSHNTPHIPRPVGAREGSPARVFFRAGNCASVKRPDKPDKTRTRDKSRNGQNRTKSGQAAHTPLRRCPCPK
jgi:hypothetical protein